MKIGPNYFPLANNPQGVPVSITQNIAASFTTLPVDCRGAYDRTIQIVASPTTSISTNSLVEIQISIDPQCITSPSAATWFSIGQVASTPSMIIHAGIVRGMRAVTRFVSSSDVFSLVYMLDDRG